MKITENYCIFWWILVSIVDSHLGEHDFTEFDYEVFATHRTHHSIIYHAQGDISEFGDYTCELLI